MGTRISASLLTFIGRWLILASVYPDAAMLETRFNYFELTLTTLVQHVSGDHTMY